MRTHGDYHLGQVLNTGDDFLIIDFEGEPQRTLAARKEKQSPLRDVAGMLRSFHYGAYCDLMSCEDEGRRQAMERRAGPWAEHMSNAFLKGWCETVDGAPFVPAGEDEFTRLLNAFLIEKAIYEVCYELNNRPAWVAIPATGILQIVG
jgi:trehalose synthase-fused probable maltokinase